MKTSGKPKLISVFGNSFGKCDVLGVQRVLKSHLVGTGEVTQRFESEFKDKIGFRYASAVSSCNNGFWLLLRALGLSAQDEIIIPNIHFFGIRNAIELLGIEYRIVDVGKYVPNITFEEIKDNLTKRNKAIIFLEYGGYPVAEIDRIKQYLGDNNRRDVSLILDAANSPFTKYQGRYSARNFDYAIYSFDMNKILVTGDGGMVLSDNQDIIKKVKSLSYYGIVDSIRTGFDKTETSDTWWEIESTVPSLKMDMNNIAASLGLTQLCKIDNILAKRLQVSRNYFRELKPLELKGLIELPANPDATENNVYLFWLILADEMTRNKLARFLLKNGIYTTVKYQPLDTEVKTPNAFEFYSRALDLPLNQNLTQAQQEHIIKTIFKFYGL
jgi:dTDP-4-amino-4,6-dideoxygalactose transaminase